MTDSTFRTIRPATTESVMQHIATALQYIDAALWELIAAEHGIAHADPVARGRLSIPRGMITTFFEENGGELRPCPWVKDTPTKIGTANQGIV